MRRTRMGFILVHGWEMTAIGAHAFPMPSLNLTCGFNQSPAIYVALGHSNVESLITVRSLVSNRSEEWWREAESDSNAVCQTGILGSDERATVKGACRTNRHSCQSPRANKVSFENYPQYAVLWRDASAPFISSFGVFD
jgi:hypothetical protein